MLAGMTLRGLVVTGGHEVHGNRWLILPTTVPFRYHTLYWDKLCYMHGNGIESNLNDPDAQLLISERILTSQKIGLAIDIPEAMRGYTRVNDIRSYSA